MRRARGLRSLFVFSAVAVGVIPLAGCGAATSEDAATSSTPAPVGPSAGTSLVGSWETEPVPLERVRATYLSAGASEQAAADFVAEFQASDSVQYSFKVTDRTWTQYASADGGPAVPGWTGTYTLDGATVHAEDANRGCRLDYAVDLRGDELALRVLRAEGASPACGTNDLLASHAIYESAPFTRTP